MQLTNVLSDIGHDIVERGIDQVAGLDVLAAAIRANAPVVADTLVSTGDPEIVRARAFQRAAIVATTLSTSEQEELMASLLRSGAPVVPILVWPADRVVAGPGLLAAVG